MHSLVSVGNQILSLNQHRKEDRTFLSPPNALGHCAGWLSPHLPQATITLPLPLLEFYPSGRTQVTSWVHYLWMTSLSVPPLGDGFGPPMFTQHCFQGPPSCCMSLLVGVQSGTALWTAGQFFRKLSISLPYNPAMKA